MYGVLIDIDERKEAEARQRTLLNELDHRVKNILANISALAQQTGRTARSIEGYVDDFTGRIEAIARTHTLLSASSWAGAELRRLLADELAPYESDTDARVSLEGPAVGLTPDDAQLPAIAFHELTTDAVKHGALGVEDGRVEVGWSFAEAEGEGRQLEIRWRERSSRTLGQPERRGFGSVVLTRFVPQQTGGRADLRFEAEGLDYRMILPAGRLLPAPPQEGAARGSGAGEEEAGAPLDGLRVLVVEDSALAAEKLRRICEEGGGGVLGPAATLEEADRLVADGTPDLALLDRNLEGRVSDDLARRLRARDVPVLFVTGYGGGNLPEDLAACPVLVKPVDAAGLNRAVARLLRER